MSGQTDGGLLGALGDGVSGLLGNDQGSTSPTPPPQTSSSQFATAGVTATPSVPLSTSVTTTSLLDTISSTILSTGTTTSPPATTFTESLSSSTGSNPQTKSSDTGTFIPTTFLPSNLNTATIPSSTEATSSPTATLQNETEQPIPKASGGPNTTTMVIAIAAPLGGLALIGVMIGMYKTRGWMRRKFERRGMRLGDDDVQSLREVQQYEKFNPARNY